MSESREAPVNAWEAIDDSGALHQYRALVTTLDNGVMVVDADGELTFANERAAELLGPSASTDALGDALRDESRWDFVDADGELLATDGSPFSRILERESGLDDRITGFRRPSGEYVWLSVDGTPQRDEAGDLVGAVVVFEELPTRGPLESELTGLLGGVADAFYALDDEWRFTHVADRAGVLRDAGADTDTDAEDGNADADESLEGRRIWETFEWASDSRLREESERAMETQEPRSFECYAPTPLDAWFDVTAVPSETGLSVFLQDVTARKEREQQLEQYRALTEAASDVIVTIDEASTIRSVNPAVADVFGYRPDELEGEPLTTLMPDGVAERHRKGIERYLETGEPTLDWDYLELPGQHADGSTIPLAVSFDEIEWDGDRYFTGIVRDISERRERERDLELFRTLLDHSTDSVLVVDPETGQFLDVNETACRRHGYSRNELLERSVPDLETELLDRESWRAFVEDLKEAGRATFEGQHRRKDGSTFPVEVNAAYVELGRPYVLAISRDITERKEREERLRESEARFRQIAENLEEVVWLTPPDKSEMTYVNPAYEDVWGRSRERLYDEPTSFLDAIHPEDRAPVRAALEKQPDGEYDEQYRVVRPDGSVRWVRDRAFPVADEDGEVSRIVGIAKDITERKKRERELRESERRYRTLVENFPNGAVALFDEDLTYQIAGGRYFDDADVDPGDRVGSSVDEIYPDEFAAALEAKFRETLDGAATEFEVSFDGRRLWIQTLPVENAAGEIYAGMALAQDITEREARKRDLERHTEQLETLFEVLPVGVVVAEADGEIVEANDTAHAIWGGDVFDADSVAEYEQYPVRWAESGEPVDPEEMTLARVLAGEEVTEPDILEIDAADGERRIVEVAGMPIRDASGDVIRGVVTMSDITDRRETQRRLAESERRYRTLAEHFPNGTVGVYDHDLRYTLAAGEKVGDPAPSAAETEGTRMPELYPDDVVADLEPMFRAAIEDGETGSTRTTAVGRHWQVWATPLRDADGEIFAGLSFAQDITEQVERERRLEELVARLEESNERLEQFAYAASHDLQEPLRMVSSYLQLIEDRYADDLDTDGREFLAFAVDGAERMRAMIEALLAYSRVETGGDPLEPVELNGVLEAVLEDLQVKIEESDAEITADDLPRVVGDASQLRQTLQNLVENAIEYSGDDPPRVHVDAERTDDEWIVSVRDEGIGIDPADQERIFEVFNRLHSREEHAGTGIGLALCERIVERHGGDIWVDSEPGEGATFSFTLPAVDGDDA